jgi:hypothetical protein
LFWNIFDKREMTKKNNNNHWVDWIAWKRGVCVVTSARIQFKALVNDEMTKAFPSIITAVHVKLISGHCPFMDYTPKLREQFQVATHATLYSTQRSAEYGVNGLRRSDYFYLSCKRT